MPFNVEPERLGIFHCIEDTLFVTELLTDTVASALVDEPKFAVIVAIPWDTPRILRLDTLAIPILSLK
ncbi:hypothetical protein EXVG_00345 [Emiliania huxleyi virus 202]|nr:hypothetical protein EXVG_00345 [Emiliania huxleyi virus 202]